MTNELKVEHFHRPENSAESLPTMNINSSSNGLSWTAPVPHFVCLFLVVVVVVVLLFFTYIYFLSEEVVLTAVCAFERQTKFVKN